MDATSDTQPGQLPSLIFAGRDNRHQQDATASLLTEDRVLTEKPGKTRILLNGDRRPRLAVKVRMPGRRILARWRAS